jgi:hypothetical protein
VEVPEFVGRRPHGIAATGGALGIGAAGAPLGH